MQAHHFFTEGFGRASNHDETARKEQIVMAFVMVTEGRIPTDLDALLRAMRGYSRNRANLSQPSPLLIRPPSQF
jgi:hypothetical protein